MREIAKELKDEDIYKTSLLVHKLHINFYDEVIDPKDIDIFLKETYKLLKRLEKLIEKISPS